MLDCNKKITIVKKKLNHDTREDELSFAYIEGCSWFRTEQIIKDEKGAKTSDIIKVRIPFVDVEVNKGDIIVLGFIAHRESIGKIRQKYQDSFEVQSITRNTSSNAYSCHIRVSGS